MGIFIYRSCFFDRSVGRLIFLSSSCLFFVSSPLFAPSSLLFFSSFLLVFSSSPFHFCSSSPFHFYLDPKACTKAFSKPPPSLPQVSPDYSHTTQASRSLSKTPQNHKNAQKRTVAASVISGCFCGTLILLKIVIF